MSKGKYYFSKSLEKGLKILALFNRQTPVLTQSQIARTLGLNMTSTYRYINTLVELGYLQKDPKTKEIRPSVLCLLICTNLVRATDHLGLIKAEVDRVYQEHNISIDVVFAVDDTMVRIYNREAQETLTYSLPDFSKNCLHNTSLGKAYLSSLPAEEMQAVVDQLELIAKTDKTICDKKALVEELHITRKRQYALAEEEYLTGLIAIGAPLVDPNSGKGVGAVSFDFSIIQHSAAEIKSRYADMIITLAHTISTLLPPDPRRN
jgi:DNA-binding IclR family transcriptional regulator